MLSCFVSNQLASVSLFSNSIDDGDEFYSVELFTLLRVMKKSDKYKSSHLISMCQHLEIRLTGFGLNESLMQISENNTFH